MMRHINKRNLITNTQLSPQSQRKQQKKKKKMTKNEMNESK